jgi:hypothetical protein
VSQTATRRIPSMLGAPAIPLISGDKRLVGRPFRGDITQAQELGGLALKKSVALVRTEL